ncbi:protein misato homolog 1-like [Lineus longissimus]|uniref:protein misato homolog 1-like n=1 Tax=Lineus longissimus TaxID=88925 RepID=UPI002B4E51CA
MGSTTREIVTLQIGHYSNHIGTHWWNTQESSFIYDPKATDKKLINHDVVFREGQTLMGDVTFTPRLIAIDLKGSLNTLRKEGTLYEINVEDDVKWQGDVTLHKTETGRKNKFLEDLDKEEARYAEAKAAGCDEIDEEKEIETDTSSSQMDSSPDEEVFGRKLYDLDESVSVWSDYLKVHFHPKSLCIVEEYQHESDLNPFEVFTHGYDLLLDRKVDNELEDQIHFFTEECDRLQGFNVMVDTNDGFSGLGSKLIERLSDDFDNKSILTFGVSPAHFEKMTPQFDSYRVLNSLLSYSMLAEHSSLFVPSSCAMNLWRSVGSPVKLPNVTYKKNLSYHTSAILGAAIDTMMLPFRLEANSHSLCDVVDNIGNAGRKVASLMSSFPYPLSVENTFLDALLALEERIPWTSLTPLGESPDLQPDLTFAQQVVLRGIPDGLVRRKQYANLPRMLGNCNTATEILRLYLAESYPKTLNGLCVVNSPIKTVDPFPHIFSRKITSTGVIAPEDRPETLGVASVAAMTSVQSNPAIGKMLGTLCEQAKRLDIKKFHNFTEGSLETDDYCDILEKVETLQSKYSTDVMMDLI